MPAIVDLLQKVRSYDKFGQKPGFNMRFEGGNAYVSYMGALCSLIFVLVSLTFLYSKIMVLVEVSGVSITQSVAQGALTYDDKFSALEDGLFLAAALTPYDSKTEPIYDSRYGDLVIEQYGWGNTGSLETERRALDHHQCSEEELGLSPHDRDNGSESHVYPVFESSYKEVYTWRKKFRCMKREDLVIWGDYNSAKAQQISIKFNFCKDRDDCFSEAEIKEWLKRKFIVLLYNQRRFDPSTFHEATRIEEARIAYIPISS